MHRGGYGPSPNPGTAEPQSRVCNGLEGGGEPPQLLLKSRDGEERHSLQLFPKASVPKRPVKEGITQENGGAQGKQPPGRSVLLQAQALAVRPKTTAVPPPATGSRPGAPGIA